MWSSSHGRIHTSKKKGQQNGKEGKKKRKWMYEEVHSSTRDREPTRKGHQGQGPKIGGETEMRATYAGPGMKDPQPRVDFLGYDKGWKRWGWVGRGGLKHHRVLLFPLVSPRFGPEERLLQEEDLVGQLGLLGHSVLHTCLVLSSGGKEKGPAPVNRHDSLSCNCR